MHILKVDFLTDSKQLALPPSSTAQQMVELAGVKPGMLVLEPNGGNGNNAEQLRAAGAEVEVAEISTALRKILDAKGFKLVGDDFMEYNPGPVYDAIVMNPPFSNGQDMQHIQHAYTLLKPGGKLVAIAGEGAFFRGGNQEQAFRAWLEEQSADVEKLPEGTFNDKSLMANTSTSARMIVLEKPGEVAATETTVQKEPWEMTLAETESNFVTLTGKNLDDNVDSRTPVTNRNNVRSNHYKAVYRAIKSGKPVPAHVLADYPDLQKPAVQDIPKVTFKQHNAFRKGLEHGTEDASFRKDPSVVPDGDAGLSAVKSGMKSKSDVSVYEQAYNLAANTEYVAAWRANKDLLNFAIKRGDISPSGFTYERGMNGHFVAEETENAPKKKDAGKSTLLSRSAGSVHTTTPISLEDTNRVLERFLSRSGLEGKINLIPVDSFDLLPPDVKQAAIDAGGNKDNTYAVLHNDGSIYLIRDAHETSVELEKSIFHEVYGHLGFFKLFGKESITELNRIFNELGGVDGLRSIAEKHDESDRFEKYWNDSQNEETDEARNARITAETMAMLAERKTTFGQKIKAVIGIVKEMLRRIGFGHLLGYSDKDLAYLIARGGVQLQRGETGKYGIFTVLMTAPHAFPYLDKEHQEKLRAEAQRQYDEVVAKYKGTDQWLKAPNGMKSHLSEKQWVQVRTQAFKEWFGDWETAHNGKDGNGVWAADIDVSKVVHPQTGEPLVVYHGTKQGGFAAFDPAESDKHRSPMIFAASISMAA